MSDKITVTIEGFNTKAEADAFMDWYSGSGEQESSVWFECRKQDGDIDVEWMGTVGVPTWNGNDATMVIKPQ